MLRELAAESGFDLHRIGTGICISTLPARGIYAIESGGVLINQVLASPLAGGIHQIYLRLLGAKIESFGLIGPHAEFDGGKDFARWTGEWRGLRYECACRIVGTDTWCFQIDLHNASPVQLRCDVVQLQDVGLGARPQVRNNELFNSQYLDHTSLTDARIGCMIASRQTQAQPGGTYPWLLQGCLPAASGFTTEGLDFFAPRGPASALERPVIGQRVRQGETAYVALQSNDATLAAGASQRWTFFAQFDANHPDPTAPGDAGRIADILKRLADLSPLPTQRAGRRFSATVFDASTADGAEELSDSELSALFPRPWRHEETINGRLHSFFFGHDARHVVLRVKENASPRPHGHILRAGGGFAPDCGILSVTCYAAGVFASHLAMGNTSLAKLISGTRDRLNVLRSGGIRMLVRSGPNERWSLLAVPTAFEMAVDECRWIYKTHNTTIAVTCRASHDDPILRYEIASTRPVQLLVSAEICAGSVEFDSSPRVEIDPPVARITVRPDPRSLLGQKQPDIAFHIQADAPAVDAIGGDELLCDDGQSRQLPYLAIRTRATQSFCFSITGELPGARRCESQCPSVARLRADGPKSADISAIQDALVWFARDAMVHLCTPRGLEQANGAAWGVRDVCQGPVEFLLSGDRADVVADILRLLFAQQYHDRCDWPQWFMFPPFEQIQSTHAHGDVIIWPLKALCDYLEDSNDPAILHEQLPYTDEKTFRKTDRAETMLQHVDRLIEKVRREFLPGLALPRFGEGDWDDSLQPADGSLRERMVSSWTTELLYQTLRRWSQAMAHFGESDRATAAAKLADAVAADFHKHLVPGGIVAGFGVFDPATGKPREYLLHPSDERTGLRYRLIPMTRGIISRIFTREQAERHLALIHEHLLFPDGARLMDRPTNYDGGRERIFRRSESAAFFGREIGLQYVHAHLRYAEALAAMGRADDLLHALLVVNPIAVTQVVPNARPRQRNCFFSSSDAAFDDRRQASRDYDKLRRGEIPVDGGWRIYSSGPGLYTNMVVRQMLGIRRKFGEVEIDPVLPAGLDGLVADVSIAGRPVQLHFKTGGRRARRVNFAGGEALPASAIEQPYREGGIRVPLRSLASAGGEGVVVQIS